MSNLNLSLVAGHDVDAPSQRKRAAPPQFSLTALVERLSWRLYEAERKEREANVVRYINESGGLLTDEIERRISRDFGRSVR